MRHNTSPDYDQARRHGAPLLDPTPPADKADRAQAVFDAFEEMVGLVPAGIRLYGISPPLLETFAANVNYFHDGTRLTPVLVTLIRYLVSDRIGCRFCIDFNERLLHDMNVDIDAAKAARADITAAREQAAKAELQRTLLESLAERASFEVPPGMIERQLQQQLREAREQLEARVPEEELIGQLERWREQWRESAERKVREGLLLEAVVQAEGLDVSPQEIEARIQEMAAQQGVDPGRLRKTYGGEVFERALGAQMADEKALDFLAARAKVEETTGT